MKSLLVLAALALTTQSAMARVVYGVDNREDVYKSNDRVHLRLTKSTAAMIHLGHFQKGRTEGVFDLRQVQTLERGQNVCASERFAQQPAAASCSGFLVGPDTLITAGHCYVAQSSKEEACKNFAWVFDFDMKSASSDPTKNISMNNVYLCKSVFAVDLNEKLDYAIIKLDRPVVGRAPLKFRKTGRLSEQTNLVVIGHPTGLPTKISPAGNVTNNTEFTRFSTNLDTFHGNSGSAVFDDMTGQVEGILIQGKTDYIPSNRNNRNSCMVVNTCDNNAANCTAGEEGGPIGAGEVVLRITTIAHKISQALEAK